MIAGLPYDAEVEYLKGNSSQYIDTGKTVSDKTEVELWFTADQYANTYIPIFGVYQSDGYLGAQISYGGDPTRINAWRGSSTKTNIIDTATLDQRSGVIELKNGKWGINGTFRDFPSSAFKSTSTAWYNKVNGLGNYGAVRKIGYIKIWENGTIVFNAIPVRFTNELGLSEGAMYDRVSRRLFRNAGTGSFTVGPDVAKPVMALRNMSLIQSLKTQFRRVKYITCTSGDVWFPTGVFNTDAWTLDSITKYGNSGGAVLFGAKYSQTYWSGYGLNLNYGSCRVVHGDRYSGYFTINNVDGLAVHCECTASGCSITWGEQTRSITSSAGLNGEQIYLLGNGDYTSKSGCMGETKITRGGILLAHLFPCVRISDGAPVFYDSVSNRAITNTSTGTAGVIEFI